MTKDLNEEIANEIMQEEEARIMAEFAPKDIQRGQVKGAKFAWMAVAIGIDLTTAYALYLVFSPYWWYAVLWAIAGAGGLMFAEWLWERVGNNEEQTSIASTSKNVSAIAIVLMAVLAGVAMILGFQRQPWMEVLALISVVGLACFHGWQAYQYHEKDDDYIAATEEARANAENLKEIRKVHRAGLRIAAKKRVHKTGEKYEKEHGVAFTAAAGRSFASESKFSLPADEAEKVAGRVAAGNPTSGQDK